MLDLDVRASEIKVTPLALPGIYVASKTWHAGMWCKLRAKGYPIASSWIDTVDDAGFDHVGNNIESLWLKILAQDLSLHNCRGVVLYATKSDFPLRGALIEVGMALALGHRIAVVMSDYQIDPRNYQPLGSWFMHPAVRLYKTIDAAFESFELSGAEDNPCEVPKIKFVR
jgi:hypothetical protein